MEKNLARVLTAWQLKRRQFLSGVGAAGLFIGNKPVAFSAGTSHEVVGAEASPDFIADIEIELSAQIGSANLRDGQSTTLWRYQGQLLIGPSDAFGFLDGSHIPVIRARRGQRVRVRFTNQLPEATIVHWHGLQMPQRMDGHPMYAIGTGSQFVYEFTVANRAGTCWFHPHPHERTGHQVYFGLSGLFIVSDEDELALGLPRGEKEIVLVVQDRTFDNANQLVYLSGRRQEWMMGFSGQSVLVNGSESYVRVVERTAHRLRLFNASNASNYLFSWSDGATFKVIGTDGGLLEAPQERQSISLAPAERVEIWVDFAAKAAGQEVQLLARSFTPSLTETTESQSGAALVQGARPIARFQMAAAGSASTTLPAKLSEFPSLSVDDAINGNPARLIQLSMLQGQALLNGRAFGEMDEVAEDEKVRIGTSEIWEFANNSSIGMLMAHPMHIHNVQFKIIERIPPATQSLVAQQIRAGFVDEGLKDVVQVMPGERVRVLVRYRENSGIYLYHCHILEHEDLGMMRNLLMRAALPSRLTVAANGAEVSARIASGMSSDGGVTMSNAVQTPATINISAEIAPQSEHIGLAGQIIVALNVNDSGQLMALNAQGIIVPFDEANVQAFKTISSLAARNEVLVFDGQLTAQNRGVFYIYVGYRLATSNSVDEIIYTSEPLQITVL